MQKNILILFVLINIFCLYRDYAYPEPLCDEKSCTFTLFSYNLDGDVLYRNSSESRIRLYDRVAAISMDNEYLYYIRSVDEKWKAGFFKGDETESTEFEIPERFESLYKFTASNKIFYYLIKSGQTDPNEQQDNRSVFIRFNPDKRNSQRVEDVLDFVILDGKSVLLKNSYIDYNGSEIPLTLRGKLKIAEVLDSRIAVISGPQESEIIDLKAEKSIYQYKENFIPELPDEYNLVVEFEDIRDKTDIITDSESSIYYEIMINGREENRTETGDGDLLKVFHAKLSPGRYHRLKPERWELDKAKGRYARMNNINQPGELKIYIPENRITKIRIEYNGKEYTVDQSVLYK